LHAGTGAQRLQVNKSTSQEAGDLTTERRSSAASYKPWAAGQVTTDTAHGDDGGTPG